MIFYYGIGFVIKGEIIASIAPPPKKKYVPVVPSLVRIRGSRNFVTEYFLFFLQKPTFNSFPLEIGSFIPIDKKKQLYSRLYNREIPREVGSQQPTDRIVLVNP